MTGHQLNGSGGHMPASLPMCVDRLDEFVRAPHAKGDECDANSGKRDNWREDANAYRNGRYYAGDSGPTKRWRLEDRWLSGLADGRVDRHVVQRRAGERRVVPG